MAQLFFILKSWKEKMKLTNFPIPISSNKLYSSFRGRLVKSQAGRQYDNQVQTFVLFNKRKIEAFKKHVHSLLEESPYLSITTVFVFRRNRILTKQGKMKKIDVSNRLKQTFDHLAKMLEIDDNVFINPIAQLAICDDEKDEQVIISVNKAELLKYEDL